MIGDFIMNKQFFKFTALPVGIFIILLYVTPLITNLFHASVSTYLLVYILMQVLLLAVGPMCLYKREYLDSLKDFQKHLAKYVLLAVVLWIVIAITQVLSAKMTGVSASNQTFINSVTDKGTLLSFSLSIVLTFVAPINEELIFRRILIGNFKSYVPVWALIIVSSILFGFIHMHTFQDLQVIFPYIIIGLLFACAYVKNKYNIVVSTFCHIFLNFVVSVIGLIAASR
jgi:membrane protease YdiL (CAAX protease family)